jgi:hypothetical protein
MPRIAWMESSYECVEVVPYASAPRQRQYFRNGEYWHGYLPCYLVGSVRDSDGQVWQVWEPVGNMGSSFVKLTREHGRSRTIYDPGGHWRRATFMKGAAE